MYDLSELITFTMHQWLSFIDPVTYDFLEKFGLAAFIGILIGIERERKSEGKDIFAGARTYTIASISGMIGAYMAINQGVYEILYLTTIFFVIIAAITVYIKNVVYRQVGTTGGVTMYFVFLMGVMVAFDYYLFAIMGAVAITFLLVEKNTLRDFAAQLNQNEVTNAVQFLIIIFILFPITPNTTILEVLNPKYALSIVVMVSSISFISFLLMKKSGTERGIPLSGFIGGLVNSEATTGSLAALSRKKENLLETSYRGIVLSNVTMLIRNLIIAFIVDPTGQVLLFMLPPQMVIIAVNIGMVVKKSKVKPEGNESLDIESPFALKPAFKFAFGFTLLILLSHYLNLWFGSTGVFFVALGGLVSSAAVTASVGALALGGSIPPSSAALVAVLACLVSTSNKILIVKWSGSDELGQKVKNSFLVLIGFGAAALVLWALVLPFIDGIF
ncbi:MAG: MgtC/SapB family protein [ANME-2 cluster archaeon]|nr:MgtC/SapB family protein [ANME-2 cluster archaeon]